MLESLEIENFRGIKKLKIYNFKNINFFIGKANTSKTSLLESLYISLLKSPKYNINNDFNYSFITSENASFEMNIHNNLKNIVEDNSKREIFKNMYQSFDQKIKDIRFSGNKIVVEIAGLRHTINIKSMGRGFQTCINILSSIISGNKYIFIDEIENGMHFESIKTLLENILSLSKEYGLQFFITTHNKELLEILNDCLIEKGYEDMLSVYNVYYSRENNISVANYNQESFSHFMKNENEIRY